MSGPAPLIVAARGWRHAGWNGDFYPDDLPAEWRLSYYANEFLGVLLPEAQWRAAGPSQWAEWRDEVPERFRFFCEPGAGVDAATRQRLREGFGAQFGGIAGDGVSAVPAAVPAEPRALRALIESLAADGVSQPALFVTGDPPSIERMRQATVIAQLLGVG